MNGVTHKVKKIVIEAYIHNDGLLNKAEVLDEFEDEFYDEVGAVYDEIYNDLVKRTQEVIHDLIMTNMLKKHQLKSDQQPLNTNIKFVVKARTLCHQNLYKSYLGRKSDKKRVGKAVNRITNVFSYT